MRFLAEVLVVQERGKNMIGILKFFGSIFLIGFGILGIVILIAVICAVIAGIIDGFKK